MKKRVVALSLLCLLVFSLSFIIAEDDECGKDCKREKAIDCLTEKIGGDCSSLTTEEKTFALLGLGECRTELVNDAKNESECWPKDNCDLKSTAQAVLALKDTENIEKAKQWMLSKKTTPKELEWLLQVDQTVDEIAKCTISYKDKSISATISKDKSVTIDSNSCLTVMDNYWFKIAQSCQDNIFEITCDQSFKTNLIYKQTNKPTMYVSSNTHSGSVDSTTTEEIHSSCFGNSNICNYEGTLWATLILETLRIDTAEYMPYLVTLADSNEKYMPEAFLSHFDQSFTNDFINKQYSEGSWKYNNDKFYGTALALLTLDSGSEVEAKAEEWIFEEQGTEGENEGCWDDGNKVDTGFLLYSMFGGVQGGGNGGGTETLCSDSGGYCISSIECTVAGGSVLTNPGCGVSICCSKPQVVSTCEDKNGNICTSAQTKCLGGRMESTEGGQCCIEGVCTIPEVEEDFCESEGGECRALGCLDDEEESTMETCALGDSCCMKIEKEKTSYWWLWILLALIILTILGIVFRDKLRPLWLRVQSNFKKKPKSGMPAKRPGFPPRPGMQRPVQRRILPTPVRKQMSQRPPQKPKQELDDVLKKLRDMGQ